jgi:hypothetical protein
MLDYVGIKKRCFSAVNVNLTQSQAAVVSYRLRKVEEWCIFRVIPEDTSERRMSCDTGHQVHEAYRRPIHFFPRFRGCSLIPHMTRLSLVELSGQTPFNLVPLTVN